MHISVASAVVLKMAYEMSVKTVRLNDDYYTVSRKGKVMRTLMDTLQHCNVVFSHSIKNMSDINGVLHKYVNASGVGMDNDSFDYFTLEDALKALYEQQEATPDADNILVHQEGLSPYSKYLHQLFTERKNEYYNIAKCLPKQGPVQVLIQNLKPMGLCENPEENIVISNVHWRTARVLTGGRAEQAFSLHLPVDRVIGLEALTSQSQALGPARLYFVVAPSDEILCGNVGDVGMPKRDANEATRKKRTLPLSQGDVEDQEYAGVFFFVQPGVTAEGVLKKVKTRCLTYMPSRADIAFKEVAAIRLGTVPLNDPRGTYCHERTEDGSSIIKLKAFQLHVGSDWTYDHMQYSPRTEHYMETTGLPLDFAYMTREDTDDNDDHRDNGAGDGAGAGEGTDVQQPERQTPGEGDTQLGYGGSLPQSIESDMPQGDCPEREQARQQEGSLQCPSPPARPAAQRQQSITQPAFTPTSAKTAATPTTAAAAAAATGAVTKTPSLAAITKATTTTTMTIPTLPKKKQQQQQQHIIIIMPCQQLPQLPRPLTLFRSQYQRKHRITHPRMMTRVSLGLDAAAGDPTRKTGVSKDHPLAAQNIMM